MLAFRSPAILAAEDAAVLQFLLDDPHLRESARSIIRRKLSEARIVAATNMPADVATINSRITYRVDGDVPVTAFLVDIAQPLRSFHGIVPLRSLVGLSILGLQERDRFVIGPYGNPPITLMLKRVLHQPQRELQAIFASAGPSADWAGGEACRPLA